MKIVLKETLYDIFIFFKEQKDSETKIYVRTSLLLQQDVGWIPGSASPGGRHGNPLWYSCLDNPTDRGTWWGTVYRVPKSQTQLNKLTCTALFPNFCWQNTANHF